jgi:hypothetical protein
MSQSASVLLGRERDPQEERQERRRYMLLESACRLAGESCQTSVSGLAAGMGAGMEREETFRLVQYLAHHGYLRYMGAGPRICLTQLGLDYVRWGSKGRRTVR